MTIPHIAATETIVDYLRKMFGTNFRVIVPQIAMSAGTMIACASKAIVMGKTSNLGPIDPQLNGVPASGVLEEFETAKAEITANPGTIPLWSVIIGKYHPTLIGSCRHAVDWSKEIVTEWLETGMFEGEADKKQKAEKIVKMFSSQNDTKNHSRHIHIEDCINVGLVIEKLEDDQTLQDLVLTIHHCFDHAISSSNTIKIIENHNGIAIVRKTR